MLSSSGRFAAAATLVLAASMANTANAEVYVGGGAEYMSWRESTSPRVKEDGMRLVLDVGWLSSKEPGWSLGIDVKWYTGSVDYEGATFFTNTPLTGTTDTKG